MTHALYLTLDDGPSSHTDAKVSFLKAHQIPAIFYARGAFIEKDPAPLIRAIQAGFLVGNHSMTHPYFSEIPLEACFQEILETEKLIEDCYRLAGIKRPCKIVRLPFGDRGAGARGEPPTSPAAFEKVKAIQNFLAREGFVSLPFQKQDPSFIDALWDWDTEDYKTRYIQNPEAYRKNLEACYEKPIPSPAILLLHDFENNQALFEETLTFLLEKKVEFLDFFAPSDGENRKKTEHRTLSNIH